ncbi:TIGR02452 family protein [Streptomonospora sp. S1-112]|uniref:TIGR02452 family protein n=1 Tax=Streptomonospora mangrovi TaxID=2883123 RepID=A0A9X3SK04_9ACTN|nr:TIGR02452 family protein [Streptomonospora mangrovi]MDA0567944.1 TIGR02452 family protein [Streptomonospora mangrovi]
MSQRMRERWRQTRDAFESGGYDHDGRRVDLLPHLTAMRAGTRLYLPEEAHALTPPAADRATEFEVTGESTLEAALRLARSGQGDQSGRSDTVAALNFASARNPGGGVANGARAQEESLARSSALYDSLVRCPEFYAHHRAHRELLYSDRVVYSPGVPVYRRDDGSWLPEPVPVAFLTAAAPNRRMIERNQTHDAHRIGAALTRRARAVLAVAADRGHTRLVLGAWGCGVFGNDPAEVAAAFAAHLHGEYAGVFVQAVFAILDRDPAVRDAFHAQFPRRRPQTAGDHSR